MLITAHNPFSSVFSFYPGVIYPWYGEVPRAFGLGVLQDQQFAGVIMGTIYITVMLIALAAVFVRWFSEGETRSKPLSAPT